MSISLSHTHRVEETGVIWEKDPSGLSTGVKCRWWEGEMRQSRDTNLIPPNLIAVITNRQCLWSLVTLQLFNLNITCIYIIWQIYFVATFLIMHPEVVLTFVAVGPLIPSEAAMLTLATPLVAISHEATSTLWRAVFPPVFRFACWGQSSEINVVRQHR